jgi:diguanylate cyclase (GGDEF)-like protein/PAS domain S-box-containing protein
MFESARPVEAQSKNLSPQTNSVPRLEDYARFLETIPDAALIVDQGGRIEWGNSPAQRFFAAGEQGLNGRQVNDLLPQKLRRDHTEHMRGFWRDARQREMGAGGQLMARRLDGSCFPIDIMLSPVELYEGQRVVCVMRDRTRQLEQERRLQEALARERELALTDPLTSAANSRQLNRFLKQQIDSMRRKGRCFTVVYLDLDHFKQVNSQGGHSEGDKALRRIAETVGLTLRTTDLLARAGGDEFVIVLPETDQLAAGKVVERVLDDLHKEMRAGQWPITFSVGVVTFRRPPVSVDAAIQQADDLMFQVKRSGRDSCRYAVVE